MKERYKEIIAHVKQTPEFPPNHDMLHKAQDETTGETAIIFFFRKLSVEQARRMSKILDAVWDAFLP